jgi:hypothetical protein
MLDEWRPALSTVDLDVRRNNLLVDPTVVRSHEYLDFLDVLKELLLASVGETINRLADEELQHPLASNAAATRTRSVTVA